jgi:PPOX class probable F420-dependent enzyme
MVTTTQTATQTADQARRVLAPFVEQRTVLLTSFRRNGTPVGTPVNIAVEGDRAFIRSFDAAWKVRRMAANPEVEVAPSTFRGRPRGPAIRARARLLEGAEAEHASELIETKHPILQGLLVPLGHRLQRVRTLHFELTPVGG